MQQSEFVKLLDYFDSVLIENKVTETNWNYYGLILDYFLDNSVYSIDFLNIQDYFDHNGGFVYVDHEPLAKQYVDINPDNRLKLIGNILNILKRSSYDKNLSENIISKTIKFLSRYEVIVYNPSNGDIKLSSDNIIGEGSYCDIRRVKKQVVKKELKPIYKNNEQLKKRMKYEYQNMLKLRGCPYILNVYSFNEDDYSYLMEEAEMNVFEYFNSEIEVSFNERLKITYNILDGMKFAHDNSIIHRDLHLGNILKLGDEFVICDFGLSKDESIERSLKSSATEKNNHIFLDPRAIGDFTKLDKKSDIYSIGKVIDYIFSTGMNNISHLFNFIVSKCTARDKEKRYNSVDEIITDITFKIKEHNRKEDINKVLENIKNGMFNVSVYDFVNDLIMSSKLCDYIVKNKLYSFGKIIIQFDEVDQVRILQSIEHKYIESTGYRQFHNYDIYADIAYFVCRETSEEKIFKKAYDILQGCATYRFTAKDYINQLE